MFSWIKTKAKKYWSSSTYASADTAEDQYDVTEIGGSPWEIGRPQRAIVSLTESQQIRGPVSDVGCGTGENALYLVGPGFDVSGVDSARAAIEMARERA
jgi:SAM-dependent methyltransferase